MMQLVPGWHPMIVHFPLALDLTATACLTLARAPVARSHAAALSTVGTWNLCLGAVAAFFALGSGLAASVDLNLGLAAHAAVSSHFKAAAMSGVLVLLAAVWRGAGGAQTSRPSWAFLLILWAATAALLVTGYRGGQNVYRHGVGVVAPDRIDKAP